MFGADRNYYKKRKVAIYARVSTEHEAQLSALANQKDWYSPILGIHPEWEVVKLYADEGVTGTAAYKRKSFMQMIDDAIDGKFDLILTREVSRFARNTVDTLSYTRKLKKHHVEVYFISDGIKTFDPDGELRLTIMATLAQDESRKTSARVKCGQQTSMEKGVVYGNGNVLGYDRVGRELVVNPEQAKTVRMIFDWYTEGKGLRTIQWELERRGIKTALGKTKWHLANISRILQNPIYIGILTYHKEFTPDFLEQKKILNHGELEILQVQGRHEHIISDEQFAQVQRIFDYNRREKEKLAAGGSKAFGRKRPSDIWVKKLECECGCRFNRKQWTDRGTGKTECAYKCYRQISTGTGASRRRQGMTTEGLCMTPMVPEWKLQMMAKEVFRTCITDADEIFEKARSMLDKHIRDREERKADPGQADRIKEEMEGLKKRLENCVELRIEGEISKEIFQRKKSEYEVKIEDLKKALKKYASETEEKAEEESPAVRVRKLIGLLRCEIEEAADAEEIPNEILEAFVDRIVVHESSFDWYLRYAGKDMGASGSFYGNSRKEGEGNIEVAELMLTEEKANAYRMRQGKKSRKLKWNDITVHVFI